jgi:hypothetical protein
VVLGTNGEGRQNILGELSYRNRSGNPAGNGRKGNLAHILSKDLKQTVLIDLTRKTEDHIDGLYRWSGGPQEQEDNLPEFIISRIINTSALDGNTVLWQSALKKYLVRIVSNFYL